MSSYLWHKKHFCAFPTAKNPDILPVEPSASLYRHSIDFKGPLTSSGAHVKIFSKHVISKFDLFRLSYCLDNDNVPHVH